MGELIVIVFALLLVGALLSALVLPIIALVISSRTRRNLEARVARLEAFIEGRTQPVEPVAPPPPVQPPPIETPPVAATPPVAPRPRPQAEHIESIIGRRWIGWAAIILILFAAAFFLKYAFENRWIGEVGRVAIGITAGILMNVLGLHYHRRNWKIFSQILTAGGVVLLYLSTYAAFGYYHLVSQKAAFAFLALLVAETAVLAIMYNAPAIAIMALVGGFLTPLLLRSDRDQYRSLFGYLIAIDAGALAVLKHWNGLRTLAFAGTHLLFWIWYAENYHPQKRFGVVVFHGIVFAIFLAAHLARNLFAKQKSATLEDVELLVINPFVFFATTYFLLNPTHHDWMGVFAILMAVIYAASANLMMDRSGSSRRESLALVGVALTFVTIAIPIQLSSNWITISWAVEALLMFYAALTLKSAKLRAASLALFGLAILKLIFWDTQGLSRPIFVPVMNRYFLSSLFVCSCLFAAVVLHRKLKVDVENPVLKHILPLAGIVSLWFVMSVEIFTFFSAQAYVERVSEDAKHLLWLGQMALSVLWATYAATLAAIGLARRSATTRWAALSLFVLSIVKAMLVDIAELRQLYRIVVFFVLGLLLLTVAWGYHKVFQASLQARESQK